MLTMNAAKVKVVPANEADTRLPKNFLVNVSTLKTILPKLSNNLDLTYEALLNNGSLKNLCFLSTHSEVQLLHETPEQKDQASQIAELMSRMVRENTY